MDVFITNSLFLWKTPKIHSSLVQSDHQAVIIAPSVPERPRRKSVYFKNTREHFKAAMDRMMQSFDWDALNPDSPSNAVENLNATLRHIYNCCFPFIKVKISSGDPPFMPPQVKHLCIIRNKNQCLTNENLILQEKINKLIRENQIHAVSLKKQKYNKGSKGWWQITNKITGRKVQNVHVSSVQFSSVLYFSNRYYLQNWTCPQVADANLGGSCRN